MSGSFPLGKRKEKKYCCHPKKWRTYRCAWLDFREQLFYVTFISQFVMIWRTLIEINLWPCFGILTSLGSCVHINECPAGGTTLLGAE